ncbi:MAG: NrdH-redoxin [Anaerolineales bacterium]|nr:NrdH-redoxin [Anaerolineales bacterium]
MTEGEDLEIIMYSTSWCPDCVRAKMVLRRLRVPFRDIDVDKSKEGLEIVVDYNHGQRVVPTIFFPDGSVLVEPSNQELKEKVKGLGLARVE